MRLVFDKGLAHSALGQATVALTSLAGLRIYTELLPRESFGRAMLAMGLVAICDGLVVMAFNQTLLCLCASARDQDERRRIVCALTAHLLAFCVAASLLAVMLARGLFGAGLVGSAWLCGAALLGVYVCEEVFKTSMTSPLLLQRRYSAHAVWIATEAVLCTASVAFVLIAAGRDWRPFLAGFVAGRVCATALFSLRHFRPVYQSGKCWRTGRAHVLAALRYGLPVSAMSPLGWLSVYLDRYALGAFTGLGEAGGYAAAAGLVSRPYGVTTALLTTYFRPRLISERTAFDQRAERQWLIGAAAFGLFGTTAFIGVGPQIATLLLAPEYRPGAPPLFGVLAAAQTLAILTHAADNSVLSRGESARLLKLQAAFALAPVALVPLGAAAYGPLGAASGRLVSEAARFCATYQLSRRLRPGVALARAAQT